MLVCPKCRSTYTRHQEHCGLDGTKLVRADADPLIGQIIDKYRIDQRLGSGGMATVYRARHQFLDKDYAVKVLHGQIAADSTMARRFHREAKTLGQIKHPNVVSVDNFGVTSAGLLYMVMEYLNGATLGQVLRKNGPFAPARAAEIVRQIATGLQAAHRKGFVHRDLKPGNVMLIVADEVDSESVKLMDFGLVRILSDDTNTQLTQEGQFFGTPMYMAPEQIAGTEVGPATDLYALGVLLYQMLSGKPPFTGDIKRLAFQHVQTPPPALASPYGGLSDLSRDLMAKMVERRPADAQVVIDRIDEMALTPASKPLG
ncbi:MAG: serine/threonine-protein kinase, partial [Myxococcota bacterium]